MAQFTPANYSQSRQPDKVAKTASRTLAFKRIVHRHLTPCEMVDLVEGRTGNEHAAHLQRCDGCRATIADLRLTLLAVRDAGVPELPAQFWEAFSIRLQTAIDADKQTGE